MAAVRWHTSEYPTMANCLQSCCETSIAKQRAWAYSTATLLRSYHCHGASPCSHRRSFTQLQVVHSHTIQTQTVSHTYSQSVAHALTRPLRHSLPTLTLASYPVAHSLLSLSLNLTSLTHTLADRSMLLRESRVARHRLRNSL